MLLRARASACAYPHWAVVNPSVIGGYEEALRGNPGGSLGGSWMLLGGSSRVLETPGVGPGGSRQGLGRVSEAIGRHAYGEGVVSIRGRRQFS